MFPAVCRDVIASRALACAEGAHTEPIINVIAEIKRLHIHSGAMKGAFLVAPEGCVNWYFSNLGLLGIVEDLNSAELSQYIKPYLNLYIARLNHDFTIDDVVFETDDIHGSVYKQVSDSDDSYAATFLSLACAYLAHSKNHSWWNEHSEKLRNIAYYNLTTQVKINGLSSVFQSSRKHDNSAGYLMDNCEAYRGLRDFANTLAKYNSAADAAYYHSFADQIASSIDTHLFAADYQAFCPSDEVLCGELSFYPEASCQIFPQAFGLDELAPRFDSAWQYLQRLAPGWAGCEHDEYPWSVIGYVAALRGNHDLARQQLRCIQTQFSQDKTRANVTINELGFYHRTQKAVSAP